MDTPTTADPSQPAETSAAVDQVGRSVIAQIRPDGCDLPLPQGWVTREMGWDGQPAQVAYDPDRFKLLELHRPAGGQREVVRERLAASGWRQMGTDSEGCELWAMDRHQDGLARLERLCHGATAGSDELVVA